jgi:hypothetical protein
MNQLGFPSEVTAQEIAREKTFGGSIALCAKAAGLEPKQITDGVRTSENKPVDKAAWSRWINDNEGVEWPKLVQIMDRCGNDAPLLWMLHARGYELASLRPARDRAGAPPARSTGAACQGTLRARGRAPSVP